MKLTVKSESKLGRNTLLRFTGDECLGKKERERASEQAEEIEWKKAGTERNIADTQ